MSASCDNTVINKLYHVLILTLALNFLAVAGGVGWLWGTGRLDKAKIGTIQAVLFPPPPEPAVAKLDDTDSATTQPSVKLDELLARASGRTAAEQVEFIQQSFDAQMSQLDRKQRELEDLRKQIELARTQLASDRTSHEAKEKALLQQEQESQKLAADKGFQDSLSLYQQLPSKQVKTIFMSLDDATLVRYLQAMPPRSATKIVKEFKSPDETARIQRVLERMRQQSQASAGP